MQAASAIDRRLKKAYRYCMNYWFWISLATAPLLVFANTPHSKRLWRITCTLLALMFGAFAMHQSYWFAMARDAIVYEACQKRVVNINRAVIECSNPYVEGNDKYFNYLPIVPAAIYLGWWEILWRLCYRKKLKGFWKGMGDDRLSNGILKFSFGVTAFFTFFLVHEIIYAFVYLV
jgi:hypothetical protein